MTAHLAPNRMSVPPPNVVGNGCAPARDGVTRTPSATAFVAKVILAAIAIVMTATLVATAPPTVTIPIAAVLSTGLVASTLAVRGGRRRLARRYPRHTNSRLAPPPAPGQHPGLAARDGYDSPVPTRAAAWETLGARGALGANGALGAWAALGAMSVLLLVLALLVGERLGAVLAAIGLAGLAVLRLAATYGGWVRRSSILAESSSELDNSARDEGGAFDSAGGGR